MSIIARLKAAYAALRSDEGPLNGGHRYAIKAGDLYCWADAVRVDPVSGYPEWYCLRDEGKRAEHSKKLAWGILVDYEPEMGLEEFGRHGDE